jgi:chromosome segregation ATPase
MEPLLLVLLALAALVAAFFGRQLGGARAASAKALREVAANQERLAKLEGDSKKSAEELDAKRREIDELKDRLKDVKRKRHEDQEAARLKNDLQEVREQVEREMEKKLAQAREEAEASKAAMRRLSAEVESLKAHRPTPAPAAAPEAKPVAEKVPPAARPLKDEERARLDSAEKGLAKAKGRLEELEAEVKRLKGRAETDRRVFIVQKGEIDLAKDRFRSLESRYNELVLERDELAKQVWTLDKQLKALHPTAETAAKAPKSPAELKATGEAKPAEARPAAAEPTSGEPVAKA